VLSDTDDADIAAAEEEAFERIRARYAGRFDVRYRRRADNRAFKAGNIEDFASAHRGAFDLMLILDADSYMSAAAIRRLIAAMEADPKLGILQSLVVGMPSASPFARVFQFGMRFGMRLYTLGSAWWQADCGPYWGHNAVIRMQPFVDHCRLPKLDGDGPLAGWILSHDQVEAALMRRAGYDVRVLPVESESFEENPPSLIEFIRRELRWCHGNMQYLRLLAMPGLAVLSRVQLLLAALMFIGGAAWMAMMIVIAVAVTASNGAVPIFHADVGLLLFLTILVMIFTPKLATILDVLTRWDERRRFGGLARFLPGVVTEIVFSMLIAPVVAFSIFLFLVGLPFGRRMRWAAQQRGAALVPLAAAAGRFWPHGLFGAALLAGYASVSWNAIYLAIPLLAGLILAAPLTTLTSSAWLGRTLARIGAFAIPEETAPPATLHPLALEALAARQPAAAPSAATAAGTRAGAVADTPGS
jgi:membrane glycosyltransferase